MKKKKSVNTVRKDIPRHLRLATVDTSTFAADADQFTVDVVWTTGADVQRCDLFEGPYIERLATNPENVRLDRLNAGAPFLDTHNAYELGSVVGSVVPGTARMVDGKGLATIKLSQSDRAADTVRDIRDGIIRNVSVGYSVYAFVQTETTDGSFPIMTATDWEPCEISAVPVPADAGAGILAATRSQTGIELNKCIITLDRSSNDKIEKEPVLADEKKIVDGNKVEDKKVEDTKVEKAEDKKISDASEKTGVKKGDIVGVDGNVVTTKDHHEIIDIGDAHPTIITERKLSQMVGDAVAQERVRQTEIMTLVRRYGLEDLGQRHCERGSSMQAVKDEVLDHLAERAKETPISAIVNTEQKRANNDTEAGKAFGQSAFFRKK